MRSYHTVDVDITECFTEDAIKDVILREVNPDINDIYVVNLKGKIMPDFKYDTHQLEHMLESRFFDIEIQSDKVEYYDIETIVSEPGIKGIFTKKLIDEINMAPNEKQRDILTKALFFGIQALEGKRIQI